MIRSHVTGYTALPARIIREIHFIFNFTIYLFIYLFVYLLIWSDTLEVCTCCTVNNSKLHIIQIQSSGGVLEQFPSTDGAGSRGARVPLPPLPHPDDGEPVGPQQRAGGGLRASLSE